MQTTADFPMRRKERKLSEEAALEIVRSTEHAAMATVDEAGVPYCVPITPVYIDGALYFHSTPAKSRKGENLQNNPRCSVLFIASDKTLEAEYSVDYASAIVDGLAEEVSDPERKKAILRKFLERHTPHNPLEKNEAYIQEALDHLKVWKITILSVSGKARTPAKWEK